MLQHHQINPLQKGPFGYDVDINAAICVAISVLTMMEGR